MLCEYVEGRLFHCLLKSQKKFENLVTIIFSIKRHKKVVNIFQKLFVKWSLIFAHCHFSEFVLISNWYFKKGLCQEYSLSSSLYFLSISNWSFSENIFVFLHYWFPNLSWFSYGRFWKVGFGLEALYVSDVAWLLLALVRWVCFWICWSFYEGFKFSSWCSWNPLRLKVFSFCLKFS